MPQIVVGESEDNPQYDMFPLSLVLCIFFEDKTILSLVLILIIFFKKIMFNTEVWALLWVTACVKCEN